MPFRPGHAHFALALWFAPCGNTKTRRQGPSWSQRCGMLVVNRSRAPPKSGQPARPFESGAKERAASSGTGQSRHIVVFGMQISALLTARPLRQKSSRLTSTRTWCALRLSWMAPAFRAVALEGHAYELGVWIAQSLGHGTRRTRGQHCLPEVTSSPTLVHQVDTMSTVASHRSSGALTFEPLRWPDLDGKTDWPKRVRHGNRAEASVRHQGLQ